MGIFSSKNTNWGVNGAASLTVSDKGKIYKGEQDTKTLRHDAFKPWLFWHPEQCTAFWLSLCADKISLLGTGFTEQTNFQDSLTNSSWQEMPQAGMVLNLPREPRSSVLLPIMTEQSCAAAWEAGAATGSKRGAHNTALHGTVTVQKPKSLLCWEGWCGNTGVVEKHLLLFAYLLPQTPAGQIWKRQRDLSCKGTALLWKLINKMALGSHALPLLHSTSPFLPNAPVPPLYLVPPSAQSHAQPIPCSSSPLCWHLAPKQEVLSPKARKRGEPRLLPAAPG